MTPPPALLSAALADVNAARLALGMEALSEMPKGHRRDTLCCPVARGLAATGVGARSVRWYGRTLPSDFPWRRLGPHGTDAWLPDVLVRFVAAFDAGAFPELEES